MRVTFTCTTCDDPVEYEFAGVETHRLRRYGVQHYVRVAQCRTCAVPQRSSDHLFLETPERPSHAAGRSSQVGEALVACR